MIVTPLPPPRPRHVLELPPTRPRARSVRPDADAGVSDLVMFEEMEVPVKGGVFSGGKNNVMPQVVALVSYRSADSAGAMRDTWDRAALRPQHVCVPCRLLMPHRVS